MLQLDSPLPIASVPSPFIHPAIGLLGVLFEPDDWVELRLLPERDATHLPTKTLKPVSATVQRKSIDARWIGRLAMRNAQGYHVYFGANPRRQPAINSASATSRSSSWSSKPGADRDVACARVAFADFDRIDEMTVR